LIRPLHREIVNVEKDEKAMLFQIVIAFEKGCEIKYLYHLSFIGKTFKTFKAERIPRFEMSRQNRSLKV
jgi:hypothetical protein